MTDLTLTKFSRGMHIILASSLAVAIAGTLFYFL